MTIAVIAGEPQIHPELVCRNLGLITTELVLNAVKHAFADRERGHIQVCLAADAAPGRHRLIVVDDGVGFAALPDPASLGLDLVAALARQIDGECHAASTDRGVAIKIGFWSPGPQAPVREAP